MTRRTRLIVRERGMMIDRRRKSVGGGGDIVVVSVGP